MTAPYDDDPRDAYFDVSDVKQDLARKTGQSAKIVLIAAAFKLILALGTTAVLARLVSPEQHGLIALAMPLVLIATGLSEFGLAQAITQREHVTHRLASSLFWTNLALGLALCLGVIALGGPAAAFYEEPRVTQIFWVLAPYVLLNVLNTQYIALLRRRLMVKQIEASMIRATIISSAVAIGVAFLGYGIAALVLQLLLMQALVFVFLLFSVRWRPSVPWRAYTPEAFQSLRFGGFLAGERLLNDFGRTIVMGVIGRSFSELEAAIYYRSEVFAVMPQRRVMSPLSAAFIPSLSRLQDTVSEFENMVIRQVSRTNLIIVPIGAIFITCPDFVVAVLLGPNWTAAVPVLGWLGVLPLTAAASSIFLWTLVASGRGRQVFVYRACATSFIAIGVLGMAAQGLVPLVATYAVIVAVVNLGLLSVFVVRYTAVSRHSVLKCLGDTALLAGLLVGVGYGVRVFMEQAVLTEALAVLILTGGSNMIWILLSPSLRADVAHVLGYSSRCAT